jgi:hypothetical protein
LQQEVTVIVELATNWGVGVQGEVRGSDGLGIGDLAKVLQELGVL